jgi:hypothetical protein
MSLKFFSDFKDMSPKLTNILRVLNQQQLTLPAVVPVVPAPASASASPPPRSPSPIAPPRPTSPIGIGARLPRHTRMKPREWWKLSNAQLDDGL